MDAASSGRSAPIERIVITGGTSGLGLAMARALVRAGATVAITSRARHRAQAVAATLGTGVVGIELDVRDEASVVAAIDRAEEALGGVDMLVNNAGIGMLTVNPRFMTEPLPFWSVSPSGFRDVFETKVTGAFLVAREVVPRMLEAGGGRIVTISMSESTMTRRGFTPYGPSGAAVDALARIMAADLAGTSITANILLPGGATDTGMAPADAAVPLLDPSIMGDPIVWLASSAAVHVHDERIVARDFEAWRRAREAQ